jgi:hypothetical protein
VFVFVCVLNRSGLWSNSPDPDPQTSFTYPHPDKDGIRPVYDIKIFTIFAKFDSKFISVS